MPLVVQTAYKVDTTTSISDVIWDENAQPVIAFLKNQSLKTTSAAIIQSRDLASRNAELLERTCITAFPNCCGRKLIENVSMTKINAGIIQYGNHVLTVQQKSGTATIGTINDLRPPSYVQLCPIGTSWQWKSGYIAQCLPISCAAGNEVKEGESSCSPCQLGYYKSLGGIHPCI